jgi:hypothetical protein
MTPQSALATLGDAWVPPTSQDRHALVHVRLARGGDGLYRFVSLDDGESPDLALDLSAALGLTLMFRWAQMEARGVMWPLVTRVGARRDTWLVALPGEKPIDLDAHTAAPLVQALLACRRRVWPSQPFGLREPVAERLQLHLRSMSAAMHPRRPELLLPPTNASDVGRDWSGGYQVCPRP